MGAIFNSSSVNPWGSVSMVERTNFMNAGSVQLSAVPVVIQRTYFLYVIFSIFIETYWEPLLGK